MDEGRKPLVGIGKIPGWTVETFRHEGVGIGPEVVNRYIMPSDRDDPKAVTRDLLRRDIADERINNAEKPFRARLLNEYHQEIYRCEFNGVEVVSSVRPDGDDA